MSQGKFCLQSPLEKIIKVALETNMLGSVCTPLRSECPLFAIFNEKSSSRLNVMDPLRVVHLLCVYTYVHLHTIRIPNSCTCEEYMCVHACGGRKLTSGVIACGLSLGLVSPAREPQGGDLPVHLSRLPCPALFIWGII